MKDIVIFGTGDFAQVARVYLDRDSEYRVVAFSVDRPYVGSGQLEGLPVVPFDCLTESHPHESHAMFVAVGFSRVNRVRADAYERCKSAGYELISYVNSKASIYGDLELGDNCFVFEENVVQPFARLGNNVIIWSGNHVGHHTDVGDHVFIASHVVISGRVTIGERCFLGVNATVRDGVTLASDCVIGAGALIMRDTTEGEVYSVRGTEPLQKKSWELKGF